MKTAWNFVFMRARRNFCSHQVFCRKAANNVHELQIILIIKVQAAEELFYEVDQYLYFTWNQ